jgi:hypothetical protein
MSSRVSGPSAGVTIATWIGITVAASLPVVTRRAISEPLLLASAVGIAVLWWSALRRLYGASLRVLLASLLGWVAAPFALALLIGANVILVVGVCGRGVLVGAQRAIHPDDLVDTGCVRGVVGVAGGFCRCGIRRRRCGWAGRR